MSAPYIGSYGALGYAKEATLGVPMTASLYVPFSKTNLVKDPGLIDIKLARQQRELTTYVMPAEQKITGPVDFSLFSVMGMALVVGAIGYDQYQTGSTPTNATTLSATVSAGATQISTATSFATNSIVQVDVAGSSKSELRKVTGATGAGPYTISLDQALSATHANGATVSNVVAPFTHNIAQQNPVASFTIEENLGGLTSLQWAGAVPNKLTVKGTTKAEAQVSLDFIAQSDAQITPTTPSYSADQPFVLAGTTLSILGTPDNAVESFELTIDNKLEPRYTYSGKRYPTYLPSVGREIALKFTESLQSMTYYNDLASATSSSSPTSGAQVITLVSGSDQVIFTLPQQAIQKLGKPQEVGKTIMTDITLKAWLGSLSNSMSAQVISNQYQPY